MLRAGTRPPWMTASTCSAIGISTPWRRARASAPVTVLSPSATPPAEAATSVQLRFVARSSPARRLRDNGLVQVAIRSPDPGQPGEGRGLGPSGDTEAGHLGQAAGDDRRLAAVAHSGPSAMPAARAITFFSAPASSTPTTSGLV